MHGSHRDLSSALDRYVLCQIASALDQHLGPWDCFEADEAAELRRCKLMRATPAPTGLANPHRWNKAEAPEI